MPEPIDSWIITPHATLRMRERRITTRMLAEVLQAPEQRFTARPGRDILQGHVRRDGEWYLLRVFVDVDRTPAEVASLYCTTRIHRYWRTDDESAL